ncbi:hypothetical protein LEP1GSC193_4028 [Leptospira alstonii serovar Pingchang str. 80-412]|uniref:Uncharacterized protein n=1 Tax=Leptospira alstonii serovar Pingchang str. 80-412 TaxID=1218564 RepID=T0G2I5_9LEPT|nr:hypothetical protein LEP1GSC193_4028 [Leptospira alstonii serovar Pingchang str. 80-412]
MGQALNLKFYPIFSFCFSHSFSFAFCFAFIFSSQLGKTAGQPPARIPFFSTFRFSKSTSVYE